MHPPGGDIIWGAGKKARKGSCSLTGDPGEQRNRAWLYTTGEYPSIPARIDKIRNIKPPLFFPSAELRWARFPGHGVFWDKEILSPDEHTTVIFPRSNLKKRKSTYPGISPLSFRIFLVSGWGSRQEVVNTIQYILQFLSPGNRSHALVPRQIYYPGKTGSYGRMISQ